MESGSHEFTLPEALQLAAKMLAAGHLEPAEELCTVILQNWENNPDGMHLAGVLRHLQGRYDEAAQLIAYSLSQKPDNPRAFNSFGNVLGKLERYDEAVSSFRQAIDLGTDPIEIGEARNNLARMYRKQGNLAAAEAEVRLALENNPDDARAWYNLSLMLIRTERVSEGIVANSKAIALWPHEQQSRDSVIRALMVLGRLDEAATLYREWLAEDPGNEVVKHHLAACVVAGAPSRASDAYVATVFDRFSSSFDSKLQSLKYRAPEEVTEVLRQLMGEPQGKLDIADAGCGTGLVGMLVKPWARRLVGFDLSSGMLEKAAPRGVYDELHQAELAQFLKDRPGQFDVVLSADTIIYFGDLTAPIEGAFAALRPRAPFIYTLEALPATASSGYLITKSGRYAHTRAYVDQAMQAAGFAEVAIEPVQLRMEAGAPVEGWMVAARKP